MCVCVCCFAHRRCGNNNKKVMCHPFFIFQSSFLLQKRKYSHCHSFALLFSLRSESKSRTHARTLLLTRALLVHGRRLHVFEDITLLHILWRRCSHLRALLLVILHESTLSIQAALLQFRLELDNRAESTARACKTIVRTETDFEVEGVTHLLSRRRQDAAYFHAVEDWKYHKAAVHATLLDCRDHLAECAAWAATGRAACSWICAWRTRQWAREVIWHPVLIASLSFVSRNSEIFSRRCRQER